MTCVTETLAERAELEALGERICTGAGHLAAAMASWLGQVEEFDRRSGWAVDGVRSCAHWLSWKCGIGLGAAREHVRVARSLAQFPLVRVQLASGRLSYSKVRALIRVVTAATEDFLVDLALSCTGAQLELLVAGLGKAQTLDEVNARHETRNLSTSWAEDGSLLIRARLSPEDGAVVLAALDAARGALTPPENEGAHASTDASKNDSAESSFGAGAASAAHARRALGQANADALVAMSETLLAAGPAPAPGGERYQASLHIDLDDLLAQHAEHISGRTADHKHGQSPCRVQDGPQLHPETARRITCDSAATVIAHHQAGKPGTSMDVGRRTRVIPTALRKALFARDRGCRFPGCTQRTFVDAHHVRHWSRGGPTALHNLVLLCRRHHRLTHEGGFGLLADGHGSFTFTRPDCSPITEVPVPVGGDATAVQTLHDATITPMTTVPDWYGDTLQLDYTVELLRHAEQRSAADPRLN